MKISLPSDDTDVRDGGEVHAGPGSGHSDPSANVEERLAVDKRLVVYGIYFDFASDRIRTESEPILKEIADALGSNPTWRVNIEGHTDNVGGDAYNLALSRRRSDAVRRALAERYGIAAERLSTAGYGASVPKDTNDTPEGRAKNRRVELVRLDGAELEAAPGRAVPESTLATSVHQRATQGMPTMQSGTCSPR